MQGFADFRKSWLQVSRGANASRMGQGTRPQRHAQAVRSEKGARLRGTMSANNAPDRQGIEPRGSCSIDRKSLSFLMLLQWVTGVCKTCNQLPVIGDNTTPYPSLTVASVEACDPKKSAKAR